MSHIFKSLFTTIENQLGSTCRVLFFMWRNIQQTPIFPSCLWCGSCSHPGVCCLLSDTEGEILFYWQSGDFIIRQDNVRKLDIFMSKAFVLWSILIGVTWSNTDSWGWAMGWMWWVWRGLGWDEMRWASGPSQPKPFWFYETRLS